ncbi:MAG: hypothetical protein K6G26_08075 [Lachnospiraceae bacterium]|nr:hypothetical protein [Lachnospiraceae bacterium]
MKKHLIYFAKGLLLVTIIVLIALRVNKIMLPKYYFNGKWPTTSGFKGFYEMPENSIDVFFLGSSHAVSQFIPQEIYNEYNIKSYNLGCEQQNLLTSYYWLNEALSYQKPEYVVLDTYMCFEYKAYEPLNTSEACTRKAFDSMKWSKNKCKAVKDICSHDSNQLITSYYMTNIRYHTRWTKLIEDDFSFEEMENHYELKGYAPLSDYVNNKRYKPYNKGADSFEESPMVPLMEEYLEKITDLCKENNIELLLVKTPTTEFDINKSATVSDFAKAHNLEFIDFNEEEYYNAINFDFRYDMHDNGHGNLWGAKKISSYVGKVLHDKYGESDSNSSDIWSSTNDYYIQVCDDCSIKHISDIGNYLEVLNKDDYTYFITAMGDVSEVVKKINKKYKDAFDPELKLNKIKDDISYYAISDKGNITANQSDEQLLYHGAIRNGILDYEIMSASNKTGDSCYIKIDNVQHAVKKEGLNIVIYNNDTMKVVDSVCFMLDDNNKLKISR